MEEPRGLSAGCLGVDAEVDVEAVVMTRTPDAFSCASRP